MYNYFLENKENLDFFYNTLNENEINTFTDILIKHKDKNIIFLGIGKSYNICLHWSDLLKCINFSSIVLETSKLLHGDIGFIKEDSLIIIISNSGNTYELFDILKIISNTKNNNIILLSSNKNGELVKFTKYNFIIPIKNESKFIFSLIPSLSVINYILYLNIIIGNIIKKLNLSKNIYIENHYNGNIGNLYKKVKDNIILKEKCCVMNMTNSIKDLIISMNLNKIACAIVEDENKEVIAFITDKDIRNYFEKNDDLNEKIKIIMNKNFFKLYDENIYINEIKVKFKYIPIIKNKKLLGIFYKN